MIHRFTKHAFVFSCLLKTTVDHIYMSSVIAQTRRSICSTTTTRKILGDLLRYTPLPPNSNTSGVEIALYPMYLELD
jgi:hypothetical protein